MRRLILFAAAPLLACASSRSATLVPEAATTSTASTTATAAATTAASAKVGRNADIISEAEIAQQSGVTNAYDLIRRLRPNFLRNVQRSSLRANPSAPLVRLNNQVLGEPTQLRGIEVSLIQEIRYYSIVEAENLWSGDRGRPVIAVTTKKNIK
jgi:hypothetical protein